MDNCNICDTETKRDSEKPVINYVIGDNYTCYYSHDSIYESNHSNYFVVCNICSYTYKIIKNKDIQIPNYIPIEQKKRYLKSYFKKLCLK